MKFRSDDRQLDLFAKRPELKKLGRPAPTNNVLNLPCVRRAPRIPTAPATIAVLPPHHMTAEITAAVRSLLDIAPAKWPKQRERCSKVFADLLAGVPSDLRQRAVEQFLDAVDVELARCLARVSQSGGAS